MQVSSNPPVDPAITAAAIGNQIDVAIAQKALQVQKQAGEAVVAMIENVVDVSQQLANGHIDVRL